MSDQISHFSFWFALALSIGSLFFYLSSALWARLAAAPRDESASTSYDFNLAVPKTRDLSQLFSIALVAAATSLSTVFVFFLTAGAAFGLWIALCPVAFAAGNWVMFKVYERTTAKGYFSEGSTTPKGSAGLVPYLGERLTKSQFVGWLLLLISIINLVSMLVLELVVGIDVLGYLVSHTFGYLPSSRGEFVVFAISVLLLLGYVFVGGFRAVLRSDVWQYKAMQVAIWLTIASVLVFAFAGSGSLSPSAVTSVSPPPTMLWGFIATVIVGNLVLPLSQEASWQRFRAFSATLSLDVRRTMWRSVGRAMVLWFGLIALAILLFAILGAGQASQLSSMSAVLESLRSLNDWWFPLFVFPLMSVACLSAMYSTADTCVSALLYLLEYSTRRSSGSDASAGSLPARYYVAMAVIFAVSLLVYGFVRFWFRPTLLQLFFLVFGNLSIVAPTIIATTFLPPATDRPTRLRALCVTCSLCLGTLVYWFCTFAGTLISSEYNGLSQFAIPIAFFASAVCIVPLRIWRSHKAEPRHV